MVEERIVMIDGFDIFESTTWTNKNKDASLKLEAVMDDELECTGMKATITIKGVEYSVTIPYEEAADLLNNATDMMGV